MGWSLLRGHYCDPEDVRSGRCGTCGTIWNKVSEVKIAKAGWSGRDIRDGNGENYPLV